MVGNRHGKRLRVFALALGALVSACSGVDRGGDAAKPPSAVETRASERHPTSGLEISEVVVVSGETRHAFQTEMAITQDQQARGLMFRETLADDEAMLFPNEVPQTRSFWMKNTPISLDIIFIGPDQRITNIETAMPYSLDSVRSDGEVIGVFEIRGGLAQELGIAAGDRVEWTSP
ncbi:MAG: DUF192 domain-containing protein [Pseudomonadota bacterium]